MVNVQLLRAKIVERNTTQENVADKIGINRSTFYRKMQKNGDTFTVGEVRNMISALSLDNSEVMRIFFT